MKELRAATAAEVDSIKERSDLDPTCLVVALDTPKGPILGVIRRPVELDPVFFPEGLDDRYKPLFARDVANGLLFQGVTHYYFNIPAGDEAWQNAVKKWGAESVSREPEIRFKKVIVHVDQDQNRTEN